MLRMPLGSGLFGMDGQDPNQLPLVQSLMGGVTPTLRPPKMKLGTGMYDLPQEAPGNMPLGSGLYGQTVTPNIQPSQPAQPATAQPTPPAGGSPSTGDFSERFSALLNNPAFQFGLSLLGSSNSPNPWGSALQTALAGQFQSAQAKHLQAQSDAEARRAKIAEDQLKAQQPLWAAQAKNAEAEGVLHDVQGQVAKRNQDMTEGLLGGMGVLPGGQAAQGAQGSPAGSVQGGTGLFNLPPGVDPPILRHNGLGGDIKGAGSLIQDATKPIVSQNGMVYMRTPDGGVSIAPGSLAAMAQVYGLENGIKGQYGQVEIPVSNGQKMTLSPTEWQQYQSSGQLPQRYSGAAPAQAAPTQTAPANPMAAPANWQAINNNPASVGGPTPTLTKGGNAGSDRVQIFQDELAKETDPSNRAALQREIARAGGTPVVGMTQDPAQTPQMQLEQQRLALERQNAANNTQRTQADVAKTGQEMQTTEAKRNEGQANATMEYKSMTGNFDRLSQNVDELLQHPGLSLNTGIRGALGMGKIPGTQGADAAALLDTLKNKLVIGTLADLKKSSANGSSGFGQLSDREGARLEGYIADLRGAQTEESMRKALANIKNFAQTSKQNFTDQYNTLYGNASSPNVSAAQGATPQGGSAMSLDDYLAKHSGKRK